MASAKSVPEQDLDENCRLRNGLNADCLLKIFEYLNQDDLVELTEMNDHYKQLITEYIISKKMVTFSGNCTRSNSQLFKYFGKKMKNIKFVGDRVRFEHFVQQIVEYCNENQIKAIDITFTRSNPVKSSCCCRKTIQNNNNESSAIAAKKNFQNVEEVSISKAWEPVCEILETLFGESNNIRVLKLKESKIIDYFLSWKSLRQLTELHLIESDAKNENRFYELIRSQSKLERFISHDGHYSIRSVGEALAVNCSSKLQVFCDFGSVHRNRTVTDYDFISKFDNLKEVKLTSITKTGNDLYRPLMKLAEKHQSIRIFGIYQNARQFLDNEIKTIGSIPEFKNLKSLEISVEDFGKRNVSTDLDFLFRSCGIIFKNVETLILSGSNGLPCASKIIGTVPKLKKLQINNLEQWYSQPRRIVSNIAKIVEQRNIKNDQVKIVVNSDQWCDLAIFDCEFINLVNVGRPVDISTFKIGKSVKIPRYDSVK